MMPSMREGRMRTSLFIMLGIWVSASSALADDCNAIKDPDERLRCFQKPLPGVPNNPPVTTGRPGSVTDNIVRPGLGAAAMRLEGVTIAPPSSW